MKFEYRTKSIKALSYGLMVMDDTLNEWGQDGWEICASYLDDGNLIYTLKREL